MIVQYLFSSSEGDIPMAPDMLTRPFKITPSENHPFLTLGDYFEAIKEFLLKDRAGFFVALLEEHLDKKIALDRIQKLLVRSEKHGALYHLASVECYMGGQSVRYAVNTAVSERGKTWLDREYDLLSHMWGAFRLPYLPRVYFRGQIECLVGSGTDSISMFLAEWFEDYHEWHLSVDEKDEMQKLRIWDQKRGHRFATQEESFEIYKQASKILTLYYDIKNFRQIYPWHHAAGDFVVRNQGGVIDVRLTTARGYEPFMGFAEEQEINPWLALIYLLLHLTLKMRLDKVDGIGDVAWAGDFVVEAVIEGFFEGLRVMKREGRYPLGNLEDLRSLLKSFDEGELYKLFQPLLKAYQEEDPDDFSMITSKLEGHISHLYRVIRKVLDD